MVNWKTTLGGILIAIGTFLESLTEPAWLKLVGTLLVGVGGLITGTFARDYNVTSEQSGAR